jgi:hypothetical protein
VTTARSLSPSLNSQHLFGKLPNVSETNDDYFSTGMATLCVTGIGRDGISCGCSVDDSQRQDANTSCSLHNLLCGRNVFPNSGYRKRKPHLILTSRHPSSTNISSEVGSQEYVERAWQSTLVYTRSSLTPSLPGSIFRCTVQLLMHCSAASLQRSAMH